MKPPIAAVALALLTVICAGRNREDQALAQIAYAGKVNAPDFPAGMDWLNTDHPISIRELRGKVVLLDFWTFCCINCIHVLPDLRKLEEAYPDELVVVGVHSAKFATEQGTENIRAAILRYGIRHPVVNDKDLEIWNAYTANAWPTFILIDPEGKVYGRYSGEGVYDAMSPVIGTMINEFGKKGRIDRTPVRFALERAHAPQSFLSFPGKIAADTRLHRLLISDSDHNRILVLSMPDATVQDVIGSGAEGLQDGSFTSAQFRKPQGVAVEGDTIYVADTENHAIRKIDLAAKSVTTLAGTGKQAHEFNVAGTGRSVALNSPWDLLYHNGKVFIAMAGFHQIWTLDLRTLEAKPYAGSGREDLIDAPLREASLAQPSGITANDGTLYIADSEDSGVREIPDDETGNVRTIVGEGLFDFGDKDGAGDQVRLQHPIGVCYHEGVLYVADTYNNKIKKIDPATRVCTSVIGTGKTGMGDGPAAQAALNEPNGICFLDGIMYITDTNNHLIRTWDPRTGMVSTLQIRGMEKVIATDRKTRKEFIGDRIQLGSMQVSPGVGTIEVSVTIPIGYKINDIAPFYVGCSAVDSSVIQLTPKSAGQNITHPEFPLRIPATFTKGATNLEVDLVVYYCAEKEESLCLIKQLKLIAPVTVADTGLDHILRCSAMIQ